MDPETLTLKTQKAQSGAGQSAPAQRANRRAAVPGEKRGRLHDGSDALILRDAGFAPVSGDGRKLHGAHPSAIAILPMLTIYMEAATREHFIIAGFDARDRLRAFSEWSGDAHQVRQIMPPVLTMLAHDHVDQIIIAHNHPFGGAEPTEQDRITTRTVANLATLSGGHLGDHLLYHAQGWLSFRALGLLA